MRKRMLFLGAVIILLIAASGCQSRLAAEELSEPASENSSMAEKEPDDGSCNCTDDYEPVCANNQLYQNACTAECLGIKDYKKGECHDPTGKQMFPCAPTSGGLSAQQNPVCAKVHDLENDEYYWKTFINSQTACRAARPNDVDIEGFTRGECGI